MLHRPSRVRRTLAGVFSLFAFMLFAMVAQWAAAGTSAAAAPASYAPVVITSSGALRGTTVQNMAAYLGIPYAAPPVGPLRWVPPMPPARWLGTRNATAFANHCPQTASPFGIASTTEDCLYLNVFVPAGTAPNAKLPVMVWIHGGSFTSGESDDYDPDRLVARGVIVVTLNYRLGYLGFLATSALDAEPHTHANYGLLDQQFALAWTQKNIAAFGGDPTRTTVFGQSAGGSSVFAQLLSPGSAGLFSRAIIQSGAYDVLSLPTLAEAETDGNLLAAAAGCTPQSSACLRALNVATILAAQSVATAAAPLIGGPSPAIDGTMIPIAPQTALASGAFNHVPVMQGSNHDEFRLFTAELFDLTPSGPLTPLEYPAAVAATLAAEGLESFTAAVLAQYPLKNYASPDLAFSAFTTDAVFCTPAYITDLSLGAAMPLYAYEFADENAPEDFLPPVSFPYAAAHGSELQFIYDSFLHPSPPLTTNEAQLAQTMVGYWTRFAAAASPNAPGAPQWASYAIGNVQSLVPPAPGLFFGFVPEHKVAFWYALATAAAASSGTLAKHRYLTLEAVRAAARTLRPTTRHNF